MRYRSVLAVLGIGGLGACTFALPGATPDGQDAALPVDVAPCFGTGLVRVCTAAMPTTTFEVNTPTTFDTGSTACSILQGQGSGEDLCVILAGTVAINSQLSARGPRPLVLVGASSFTIAATGGINVFSVRTATPGAGANSSLCGAPATGGRDDTAPGGGGGGAGGSFGGQGGSGLAGEDGRGGTPGASAPAAGELTVVRGGCPGGAGGPSGEIAGAAAGPGGGAVYLIGGNGITIHGFIDASGAGGAGADSRAGGGGGGSGGLIGLDASPITLGENAVLLANGGGGGEGGGETGIGQSGADPLVGSPLVAARGGATNFNGGDGGAGSVSAIRTGGDGSTDSNGGGAGGGGAGIIKTFPAQTLGGIVSPPAI